VLAASYSASRGRPREAAKVTGVGDARRLVSLVVPTLDEDLADALALFGDYLRGLRGRRFEIVFVDDSSDDVRARLRDVVRDARIPENVSARFIDGARSGKGAAVRQGIGLSRGDIVFEIDADLPAPIDCIEEFLRIFDEDAGVDAVIAERRLDREFSSPVRKVVSRTLLVLQRVLLFHSREFNDTQCGFKAFRGDVIREIAAGQVVDGGMYDLEYLYVALRRGLRVAKITVVPTPGRRQSRINVWKCLRQDPDDLLRIKAHGVLGRYR
jgi:glycosyltransferase involved in cell wall biosynthesis